LIIARYNVFVIIISSALIYENLRGITIDYAKKK